MAAGQFNDVTAAAVDKIQSKKMPKCNMCSVCVCFCLEKGIQNQKKNTRNNHKTQRLMAI